MPDEVPAPAPADRPIPWGRLVRPRLSRAEAVVSLLTLVLGFALAVSVRGNSSKAPLASARQEDLVRILDDLDGRAARLRQEVSTLSRTRDNLQTGSGSSTAALAEAKTRAEELGILAGTIAATGPGIALTIEDPRHEVGADVLVDTIEELRDAGAEAMDISGVRVVAATYVLDASGGVIVDGEHLTAPYVISAIGDAPTLAAALRIPGGIVDSVSGRPGGSARIDQRATILITALRGHPSSASPSPSPSTPTASP